MGSVSLTAIEGEVPHELRPAAAERLPLVLRRLRLPRRGRCSSGSSRRPRSRRSSSSRGSARAATSLPPDGWFRYLRELCDRHGILLVCDEVQSGMGRSGTMWAIEQEGVEPDIITAGKGIASGLPLGAMIAREDLMRWELGVARLDVRGSPVSCAAALATFDVIERRGAAGERRARSARSSSTGCRDDRRAPPDHHGGPGAGAVDRARRSPTTSRRCRGRAGGVPQAGCSCSGAATTRSASRRRWCSARTRRAPPSRSSRRPSPRSRPAARRGARDLARRDAHVRLPRPRAGRGVLVRRARLRAGRESTTRAHGSRTRRARGWPLLFLIVPEGKIVKNRLHLDLSPPIDDGARRSTGSSSAGRHASGAGRRGRQLLDRDGRSRGQRVLRAAGPDDDPPKERPV